MGSLKPRTGYSPTRSRSKSLSTKSANARDSSTVLPNCLVRASRREAMLTAGPMTVKSSRVRDPIFTRYFAALERDDGKQDILFRQDVVTRRAIAADTLVKKRLLETDQTI